MIKQHGLSKFLQAIPNFRGKKRLARMAFPKIFKIKNPHIFDRTGMIFRVPSLQETIAQYIFIDGIYEPDTCRVIKEILRRDDVFFDIGANVGFFSFLGARIVGSEGSVCAFEASPRIADLLKENIRLNQLQNIRVVSSIVSDVVGETLFYEAPDEKFGMGSLSPQFKTQPLSIAAVTLDDIVSHNNITKVALIKMDVEGHEASVFKGAVKLLEQQSPVVVFEFCDWAEKRAGFEVGESQRILMKMGYFLWKAKDFLKKGKPMKTPLKSGFEMIVAKRNHQ
jgi:FkbM family methyltransferase